jgi:hypothetical protein
MRAFIAAISLARALLSPVGDEFERGEEALMAVGRLFTDAAATMS